MDLTVNQERHAYPYRIVFEVYLDKAPHSAHRFLNLLKSGHYKGTKVNKIWQDGFIQGGKGEHHSEEKYHEDENYVVKHDKPGIIGWANYGKSHTNGTQFYITMSPFSAYDGKYVAFARVVCGFRAVRFINRLPTFGTRPLVEVEISDCGLYGYDLNKLKQKV
jgi:cyclophilin family peptidyl-prolyl cis-trans isomerase